MGFWKTYWYWVIRVTLFGAIAGILIPIVVELSNLFEYQNWKYVYVLNENEIAFPAIAVNDLNDLSTTNEYYTSLKPEDVPKQIKLDSKNYIFIQPNEPIKVIEYLNDSTIIKIQTRFFYEDYFPSFEGYTSASILKEMQYENIHSYSH